MTTGITQTDPQWVETVCSRFNQGLALANQALERQGSKVRIVAFSQDESGEWNSQTGSQLILFRASCCPRIGEQNLTTGDLKRLGAVHIVNESNQSILETSEIANVILKIKARHDALNTTDLLTSIGVIYNVDDVKAHKVTFDDNGYLRVDGKRVFGTKDDGKTLFVLNSKYITSNSVIFFEDASDPDSLYHYDEADRAKGIIHYINTLHVKTLDLNSLLKGREDAQRYKDDEGGEYYQNGKLSY